ncbi:glutamyl-tRNA(Gln) amidotransferase subunit A, mitochondrial [Lepeophtheirus salmonis]|nr:glutamyl-tRNA(Gln) amidotransferase subunit A, mitochondrial-like [Lepeophtheirus salmonis]
MSYLGLSIREVHAAFRNGSLSPSKLFEESMNRISKIKHLNAFTDVIHCSKLDHHSPSGPLEGITLSVKDNYCIKDTFTTCASQMLRSFKSPYTATVVDKAFKSGAVLVGKTNMDEFAMGSGSVDSIFGPVLNPWSFFECQSSRNCNTLMNDYKIAGGSSGGSAVSVATGASMLSLGSDTGGSVRLPSAWCGICSLKPTYGALSRHGLIPLVNSLDVPGLMANHVEDLEIFFKLLKGKDPLDSTTVEINDEVNSFEIKNLRIGIPQEYHCEGMSEDVLSVWSESIDLLDDAGIFSSPVSLPHTSYSLMCYSVLNAAEVASNMSRYDGLEYGLRTETMDSLHELFTQNRTLGFNDVVKGRILLGNHFLLEENYEEYFLRALKVRHLIHKDFQNIFSQGIDLLITPVTLSDAPRYGDFVTSDNRSRTVQHDYCTQPINLAGLPAATIPFKLSKNGLPLAIQIVGRQFEDEKVLAFAKYIESKVNFPKLKFQSYQN